MTQHGERSICPFCSMGCSLLIRPPAGTPYVGDEAVAAMDYDPDGRFNRGSLCGKGNMALELLLHPKRLEAPTLRTNGRHDPVTWEDALHFLGGRLELIRRESGPRAIGVVAGPYLTNEEARLAIDLANRLGTPHVDGGQPEDLTLLGGIEESGAHAEPVTDVAQIEAMTASFVIGDLFTLAPCVSKGILDARYDRRRNVLGVLSATRNRTTWFGKPMLACRPGHETAALALMLCLVLREGDALPLPWADRARKALARYELDALASYAGVDLGQIRWVVDALRAEAESGVFLSSGFGETERPDLVAGMAALLAEATGSRFLAMLNGPNSTGVQAELDRAGHPAPYAYTMPEMIEAAVTGDLRALLCFGCDPLGSLPGTLPLTAAERLDLFAVTAPMPGESTARAHVVLPSLTWGEKPGTVENAFGARLDLGPVLPAPGTARSDQDIIETLLSRAGPTFAREMPGPLAPESADEVRDARERSFFGELELHFRLERREWGTHEVGTHLLLPRLMPAQSGDGWLTHHLSWPRHEAPEPEVVLSSACAAKLGIEAGDPVRVSSSAAATVLSARLDEKLADDVVLAPPHCPEVRRLMRWRLDPALRDLDMRPTRVSVEPAEMEVAHG